MYNSNYNPTVNDLYLYNISNTGYPIGLNPNSPLAGCTGSLRTLSVMSRQFSITGPSPPPPGLSLSQYPNYYNANSPRAQWISEDTLSGTIHYMVYPCSGQPGKYAFDYEGATANYGWAFWNETFTGLSFYSEFKPIYAYTTYNSLIGATASFLPCSGYCGPSAGTIIYQQLSGDHGLIETRSDANPRTRDVPYLRAVSPFSLISEEDKENNLINLLTPRNSTSDPRTLSIPVNDVYILGGNDNISEVSYITPSNYNSEFIKPTFIPTTSLWEGDSSSLYVYKKDNVLYSIGHVLSGDGLGPSHVNSKYMIMKFLQNQTNININYYYSNTTEKKVATTPYFTELLNRLQELEIKVQNKII